jgi:hypothetical protein
MTNLETTTSSTATTTTTTATTTDAVTDTATTEAMEVDGDNQSKPTKPSQSSLPSENVDMIDLTDSPKKQPVATESPTALETTSETPKQSSETQLISRKVRIITPSTSKIEGS